MYNVFLWTYRHCTCFGEKKTRRKQRRVGKLPRSLTQPVNSTWVAVNSADCGWCWRAECSVSRVSSTCWQLMLIGPLASNSFTLARSLCVWCVKCLQCQASIETRVTWRSSWNPGLIFGFSSSCLDRTRPDGDERLSDQRTALFSTMNSFLTVLFFWCIVCHFTPEIHVFLPPACLSCCCFFCHTFYLKVPFFVQCKPILHLI